MPVSISEEHPRITAFLSENHVGVLATADSSGTPHAATIYYVTDPEMNIYFVTKESTTKHRNIQKNPQVALAVYDAPTQSTVQLSGQAVKFDDPAKAQEVFTQILTIVESETNTSIPPFSQLEAGGYVVYRIHPRTVRLAEYVKAQHRPAEELFEVATVPDQTLK